MFRVTRLLRLCVFMLLGGGLLAVVTGAAGYWYLQPRLPAIDTLKDVHLQVPLRVYSRDRQLVAEFGEKRRDPLRFDEIPQVMIDAVIAAEDDRFYEHPGVDWQGLTRAVLHLIRTGEKGPGGSTITMQVARNFFLGREKTYIRKLNEILLALKIEKELGKNEILELYFNKIFLGHRAYGVGAAAQVYYGKPIDDLALEQVAMIAGLPKAPSRFNPIVNPERAVSRRNYVLGRMRDLGQITAEQHEAAMSAPVTARLHGLAVEVEAPYLAEMVRAEMEQRVGDDAYTAGYEVIASIDGKLQTAANQSLRKALIDYDRRHGYRGPELHVDLAAAGDGMLAVLGDIPAVGGLVPGLVTAVDEQAITVTTDRAGEVEIAWPGLSWARPHISENRRGPEPKTASDVVAIGDVVRVQLTEEGWRLAQVPEVEGGFVALDPADGAIVALTGGFDFFRSKFNRVTQARRQPGSNFKPFVYSAALGKGFTAASLINDAPVVFEDPSLEATWRPENYSGKTFGPTRLRVALYKSRNLVSIRLLDAIGVDYAVDYVQRFGFTPDRLPRNLSLALGSGTYSPLEIVRGYAVFANGGYRVDPYFIDRIADSRGEVLFDARPLRVCPDCPVPDPEPVLLAVADSGSDSEVTDGEAVTVTALQDADEGPAVAPRVLSPENVWIMSSILRDVVRQGTATRARRELERGDLGGKTGTTNEQRDAWFSGFNSRVVATAWVGFDKLQPLGRRETGGRAALPMWIEFMRVALDGMPESIPVQPAGLVKVRIDPVSGRAAGASDPDAIFETFRLAQAPKVDARASTATRQARKEPAAGDVTEQLF